MTLLIEGTANEALVFGGRGEIEYPEKNLSGQNREPTYSTHTWCVREANLGHIGGRPVLSPLCQPCFHNVVSLPLVLETMIIIIFVDETSPRFKRVMKINVFTNRNPTIVIIWN